MVALAALPGPDRVRVSGIQGQPRTPFLKVSGAYLKGYKATGQLVLSGPRALEKAQLCADIVWKRLAAAGFNYEHTDAEFLGASTVHAGIAPAPADPTEIVLRLSVKDPPDSPGGAPRPRRSWPTGPPCCPGSSSPGA